MGENSREKERLRLAIQNSTVPDIEKVLGLLSFSDSELREAASDLEGHRAQLYERLEASEENASARLGDIISVEGYDEFGQSIPDAGLVVNRYSGSGANAVLAFCIERTTLRLEKFYPECFPESRWPIGRWSRKDLDDVPLSIAAAAVCCSLLSELLEGGLRHRADEAEEILIKVARELADANYDDEALNYQIGLLSAQTEIARAFKLENDRMSKITFAIQASTLVTAVLAILDFILSYCLR